MLSHLLRENLFVAMRRCQESPVFGVGKEQNDQWLWHAIRLKGFQRIEMARCWVMLGDGSPSV